MPQNNSDAQREYNPKWRSYILICVTSLTNFVSVGEAIDNVKNLPNFFGRDPSFNYMFGTVTFAVSLIILILDFIGFMRNKFDFRALMDGKVEGWTLFVLLLWWVCGVISMTRAGAIGYTALNIYFSAWASLFACMDALNKWGGEKDILTLHQLTRLSITLPGWWIVFWASIIVLGSASDSMRLAKTEDVRESCGVAVAVGTMVSTISAFFILSHYEFFRCQACSSWLTYGGWFELLFSVLTNIWLVIGLEKLTGAGAIASSVSGNGGSNTTLDEYVPGSNIYVFIWTAFIASASVTVKWKEARAIRFAQTSGDIKAEEGAEDDDVGGDEETEIGTSNNESDKDGT